jgi:hypothetical protein
MCKLEIRTQPYSQTYQPINLSTDQLFFLTYSLSPKGLFAKITNPLSTVIRIGDNYSEENFIDFISWILAK